jgi:hypothetical protein
MLGELGGWLEYSMKHFTRQLKESEQNITVRNILMINFK